MAVALLCLTPLSDARPPAQAPPRGVTQPAATDGGLSVWFSPKGGCTDAIVEQVAQAKRTLDVQAYGFTSTEIAKAVGHPPRPRRRPRTRVARPRGPASKSSVHTTDRVRGGAAAISRATVSIASERSAAVVALKTRVVGYHGERSPVPGQHQ